MGIQRITTGATPLIPWGSTGRTCHAPAGTSAASYWDTNHGVDSLKNNTVVRTTYNPNLNPFQNQWFPSVRQWTGRVVVQSRQFKEVHGPVQRGFLQRVQPPGQSEQTSGADGVETVRASGNSPRTCN